MAQRLGAPTRARSCVLRECGACFFAHAVLWRGHSGFRVVFEQLGQTDMGNKGVGDMSAPLQKESDG